jgi:hypothetical protein
MKKTQKESAQETYYRQKLERQEKRRRAWRKFWRGVVEFASVSAIAAAVAVMLALFVFSMCALYDRKLTTHSRDIGILNERLQQAEDKIADLSVEQWRSRHMTWTNGQNGWVIIVDDKEQ